VVHRNRPRDRSRDVPGHFFSVITVICIVSVAVAGATVRTSDSPLRGRGFEHCHVTTLRTLLTRLCLCQTAVQFVTAIEAGKVVAGCGRGVVYRVQGEHKK